jgi:hypothetical protein
MSSIPDTTIRPSAGLAGGRPFHYAHRVSVGERWTDEAVIRDSERWVYLPPDGVRVEDERRLLVHLPKRWGQSRVWRSSVPDKKYGGDDTRKAIGAAGAQIVGETLRLWGAATREAFRGRGASSGSPNQFEIVACSATMRSVTFSPPPPIMTGISRLGGGFSLPSRCLIVSTEASRSLSLSPAVPNS